MKIERFFEKMMSEEYAKAGWFRRWWEGQKYRIWLDLPIAKGTTDTNRQFVEDIPDPLETNL